MHPHLETLLEIQDMKTQRADLLEKTGESRSVEVELFNISIDEALKQLEEKILEMEATLDPAIRNRYLRIASSRGRFVVPVINGNCFGCFVSIPTSVASGADRNQGLRYCDNCGRFLYMVG
jgi:predicted  nucleic acid-binding Zn-ribbon protein